ncbi:MAG: hypothetical protein A3G24_18400 [Betaproteobacteria bacterium RIFCSPLOWO2_12_FULL_62_13]|nr:MAG: hypothetical protein A3G24_18400 [Betaproteobacteria bacterium RIFCSPLOWO2_12_FULL_62_13]
MSAERGDAYLEQAKAKLSEGFHGEEDIEAASTPQKDLLSACVMAAVCIFAMVLAWQMPDPGRTIYTHPGLLPIVVGASLLAMVIGLAVRALREGGARNLGSLISGQTSDDEDEAWRAWLLIALVIVFVVTLDVVTFRFRFAVGGIELKLSSFECVAIPMTTVILKVFWRKSILLCLLTAVIAVLLLTAAFRYGFKIPMPGVD